MVWKQDIQFFDSPDYTRCFQACLKMTLAYYLPQKKYTFRELDKISGHKNGKWTWQGRTVLFLLKRGFSVVNIENLDYGSFAEKGSDYLRSIWSEDVYRIQASKANLISEQKIAKKLLAEDNVVLLNKQVVLKDVVSLIKNEFFVMVSVNPYTLIKERGYSSHMVLVVNVSKTHVTFHDPGPPGKANRKISRILFESAMIPPAKEDGNILGVKK